MVKRDHLGYSAADNAMWSHPFIKAVEIALAKHLDIIWEQSREIREAEWMACNRKYHSKRLSA